MTKYIAIGVTVGVCGFVILGYLGLFDSQMIDEVVGSAFLLALVPR